jgi:hypothetical protein
MTLAHAIADRGGLHDAAVPQDRGRRAVVTIEELGQVPGHRGVGGVAQAELAQTAGASAGRSRLDRHAGKEPVDEQRRGVGVG